MSTRAPRRRSAVLVGLASALVALAMTGCTSGGADSSSGHLDAVAAARSLAHRPFSTHGEETQGRRSGLVAGAFAPSGAARVRFPVFTADRVLDAELRRTPRESWLRRAASGSPAAGVGGALVVVPAGARPWLSLGATGRLSAASPVMVRYDPVALLRTLARLGIPIRAKAGTSHTYSADVPAAQQPSLPARRVTVVVDGAGLPTRITATATTGTIRYRISPAKAVQVAPPPAAEVQPPGGQPAGPAATGPYAVVQTVDAGGTPLVILRAPASGGGTCWKVQPEGAYHPTVALGPGGGRCLAPPDANGTPDDQVQIPVDASDIDPYELVGIAVPAGAPVTLGFADGSQRPLTRDPVSGLAVYAGPQAPIAAWVQVGVAGTTVSCGAGPVTGPDDLAGADTTQLRGGIWGCVPVTG